MRGEELCAGLRRVTPATRVRRRLPGRTSTSVPSAQPDDVKRCTSADRHFLDRCAGQLIQFAPPSDHRLRGPRYRSDRRGRPSRRRRRAPPGPRCRGSPAPTPDATVCIWLPPNPVCPATGAMAATMSARWHASRLAMNAPADIPVAKTRPGCDAVSRATSRSASAARKPTSSTPWRSGTEAPRPSAQLMSMPSGIDHDEPVLVGDCVVIRHRRLRPLRSFQRRAG